MRDIGKSVGSSVAEAVGQLFGRAQEQRPLPANLYESEDEFLAVFDAPGADPLDVQVTYEVNAIVVRVDRFREFYDGFEMTFPGRGLTLDGRLDFPKGASVNPDEASATLREDGTLYIHVPKAPAGHEDDESDESTGTGESDDESEA
jgi:HSP20 family molecular chaperone IbpA